MDADKKKILEEFIQTSGGLFTAALMNIAKSHDLRIGFSINLFVADEEDNCSPDCELCHGSGHRIETATLSNIPDVRALTNLLEYAIDNIKEQMNGMDNEEYEDVDFDLEKEVQKLIRNVNDNKTM